MTDDRFASYSTSGGQPAAADAPAEPGQTAPRFDDGFFAGPVPAQAAPAPFGTAPVAAGSPFGAVAAPAPFGSPPATDAFGGPVTGWQQQPVAPPASARNSSTWKLAAGGGALVVILLLFFAGRFGWQQFLADPVVPDTLGGMPLLSDPGVSGEFDGATAEMRSELGSGSAVKVAFYTSGQGAGYLLFSVRGGSRPGHDQSGGGDPFAGWTRTTTSGATCWSKPAQVATGVGVTFCLKGQWRRAVIVMALAATPMDPATVAQVTDEAWDAQ